MIQELINNKEDDKKKCFQENAEITNKQKIVWKTVIVFAILHVLAVYGIWLIVTLNLVWQTLIFNLIYEVCSEIGVTAGAHRLWSHRSYKAKLPLRIWLVLMQTSAFQKDVYQWAREHRIHHEFMDTDADPYNSTRGLFYYHIGWIFLRKHPDVIEKEKTIDLSDIAADPVIKFQRKYYWPLMIVLTFVLPTYLPVYFWGENILTSFFVCVLRLVLTEHATALINTFTHMYGYNSPDKGVRIEENKIVSTILCGKGWDNYHYKFPSGYRLARLGKYRFFMTTVFIEYMAIIGQAYDLKMVSYNEEKGN